MRSFAAFELRNADKNRIFDLILNLKKENDQVKWVSKKNLHITLNFFGNLNSKETEIAINTISKFSKKLTCFQLQTPRLEIVPKNNPRIIWLNFETDNTSILDNISNFKKNLQKKRFKIDRRRFKFHITLGRIKNKLDPALKSKISKTEVNFCQIISKLTLFQSDLTRKGPVYKSIKSFNLTEGA